MRKKVGSALVVGAGISGIRSALDLAEMGYGVTLIDRAPHLGGTLRQLDLQFPNDHCGMCRMLPLVDRDASSQYCLRKGFFHENIQIRLSTELVGVEGDPGKFKVTLRRQPTLIRTEMCVGCGECTKVCPVEVPDEFNAALGRRKAVYLPVPHNIPNRYVIDPHACTRCGQCEKACPTGAVDLGLQARRGFRVLVVDDEFVIRDSMKEWLEVEGFSTDTAESGFDAVDKLAANSYQLMLVDIKMPGMDGVEVLKRAKEMQPELEVIMMTAYATVETAVEAMKVGARDYLVKPFDPEAVIAMVVKLFESTLPSPEAQMEVGGIILAAGFSSYGPRVGANIYRYGELPDVVTGVEFERLVSGTGPNGGRLLRPSDGRQVGKIAWLQCVGSRNLQENADYCSSVCCMFSVKEALLAKEKAGYDLDAAIFYMDMRTFGKHFHQYRDAAEREAGVRFVRSRVHSVDREDDSGNLRIQYTEPDGTMKEEEFDLVVLATGQRPSSGTEELAEVAGIERNPWGFCRVNGESLSRSSREGIFVSGSFSGLRDISESVIQAGSASLGASSLLHSKGGSLAQVAVEETAYRDVSRDPPQVAVVLCTCADIWAQRVDWTAVQSHLSKDGAVARVLPMERLCTEQGWNALEESLKDPGWNRVLIGACQPYVYARKLRDLGKTIGLHPSLIEVVDTCTPVFALGTDSGVDPTPAVRDVLNMGIAGLRTAEPPLPSTTPMNQKALVVGGGIAGMTAARALADHGYPVVLVEQQEELGGNLRHIHRTLEGPSPRQILEQTVAAVENHPQITVHKNARIIHSQGRVGRFFTTIGKENGLGETIDHGVTILAVGGLEAPTTSYGHGQSEAVVTQHELEAGLEAGKIRPSDLQVVVMIQCVDSREEGRNYCSRICCASALKNALHLKEQNPELDCYILYRDIMAYGFLESHYTEARRRGIVFIQYHPSEKPSVRVENHRPHLSFRDPILNRDVRMNPDLLVLSTGIVPTFPPQVAPIFGVEIDGDGFFREADSKWRPLDFLQEGIFTCGIAQSPRSISESAASAEAAAQRALRLLSKEHVAAGTVVAEVRHTLCSLCERCVEACPYGARWVDEEEERIRVDEIACQGCGSCAAVCPNSASVLRGHRDQQVFAVLDALMDEVG